MTVNEKCQRLHLLFNNLGSHRFSGTEINKLGFSNGVYIIFEEGETAHDGKRIVRVGTHREPGNLKNRLNQHRRNSGSSVFRRKVGCAILNKNEAYKSYIEPWYGKKYKLINEDVLQLHRNLVTQHITGKTSFVAFEVKRTSKEEKGTLFWESKIIATIAQCDECIPSKGWLGNWLPEKFGSLGVAKRIGLWLTDEIDSPILSDSELFELEEIVEQSVKRYE